MNFSLLWLPDVLRDAGLKVIEQPGWKTRGHGDVGAIKGVLFHHTAGPKAGNYPDLSIVTAGRPDLAGPLCNLGLGRDGTWLVIAAGKAWHAGAGLWQGIHDGNSQMLGIEAANTGLANDWPWPAAQMESATVGVAALLRHIKQPALMCAGHLEYALPVGRKSDPSFSVGTRAERITAMVGFRAKVAAAMGHDAPAPAAHVPDGTEDAKWLQCALNALGAKPALTVDGAIGAKTKAAIKAYQAGKKLPATSIADAATLAALHADLGHQDGCLCGGAAKAA